MWIFSNLVGEEGSRIQGEAVYAMLRRAKGVECLLSNDFIIAFSILASSAILEKMSAIALLVCNAKLTPFGQRPGPDL